MATAVSVSASNDMLKLAVVENSSPANKLMSSDWLDHNANRTLAKLTQQQASANRFDKATSLCVALIQNEKIEQADQACSYAIKSAESIPAHHSKAAYLRSLSYSNRAVAHYKSGNISKALSDIEMAIATDKNVIIESNLSIIKQKSSQDISATEYAE